MAECTTPAPDSSDQLALGLSGFGYADLFSPYGLRRLHERWRWQLGEDDPQLAARYDQYLAGATLNEQSLSSLLCELAGTVSRFLGLLFPDIERPRSEQLDETTLDLVLFRFKEEVVKRRASHRPVTEPEHAIAAGEALLSRYGLDDDRSERRLAELGLRLLDAETAAQQHAQNAADEHLVAAHGELTLLLDWLVVKRDELTQAGFLCWRLPHPTDYQALVPLHRPDPTRPELLSGDPKHWRGRDGFALTDERRSRLAVLAEADYCMVCHERSKDSCSKGFHDKNGEVKQNPLGAALHGCPLGEKISEMNLLRRRGDSLGALTLATLDNPMCPGTGHRICNDCMKSCIFQKQEPVNIPEIETSVLSDVLALPWGVEIYGLLTRWNPLNRRRPYPLPAHGRRVLVVGLGPAGYTLCHHLSREGFSVVAIDGLKLEPLPAALVGDVATGRLPTPVRDYRSLTVPLETRVPAGFGGVSEYGITVRWDKNFLTLLYLTLLRQPLLTMLGGVRFGGTLTLDDAWQLGFDHVAMATGAGRPAIVEMEGQLCRGIRQASDFLMGLQHSGAFRRDSLANLQVRLPALVIGGGLTALDTATELLAYYPVQVEKMLARWEALLEGLPQNELSAHFDPEERQILDELLAHGRAVRAERQQAARHGRVPDFMSLIERWGGVTLVYRKSLVDSPAYRLNHEEVSQGLQEGIRYLEKLSPTAALSDEFGALRAVRFERLRQNSEGYEPTGELCELPARTMCVAAGTGPNTMYEKEHPGTASLGRGGFFVPHRVERTPSGELRIKPDQEGFFTSYLRDGKVVSYYGDNHPRFAGSVVQAMASAKTGFPHVAALFPSERAGAELEVRSATSPTQPQQRRDAEWLTWRDQLRHELTAEVVAVERLTPTIVEVKVRAPLLALKFQPGQLFRLQNFESRVGAIARTKLAMEGLAMTGVQADPATGSLSLVVLEVGGSSSLCERLVPGEPVMVMGPTGAPTEIPRGEEVCLVGDGFSHAVLPSIAKALKDRGCRVLYFAGYRQPEDVCHQAAIESHTDEVVWCCEVEPPPGSVLKVRRPGDRLFVGNVVAALAAYAQGELGPPRLDLRQVTRWLVIGSDRLMAAVAEARQTLLQPYLNPRATALGSINSPMQCMMKELCGQCLQRHRDPVSGRESVVYSCVNQYQALDEVVWPHLAARLRQNSTQEKLTALWLAHLGLAGQNPARQPDMSASVLDGGKR